MAKHCTASFLLVVGLSTSICAPAHGDDREAQNKPLVRFRAIVNLHPDLGQSFGSLFEAKDKQGRIVAGGSFLDVYNTRFRSDRHVLQFFVRPAKRTHRFTIERLPHPDLDCGVYLFDLDQKLYAWSSVRNNSVRVWHSAKKKWTDAPPPKTGRIRSGDGIMRLGTGRLVFTGNQVFYNGRTVLKPPKVGRYYNFYYAGGRLFFYHTHRRKSSGFTKIYACPWTPSDRMAIDVSKANVMAFCDESNARIIRKYDEPSRQYMAALKPQMELEDCLFSHGLPHWDPTDPAIYYLGGKPEEDGVAHECFRAVPHRIIFVGHFHRWFAATPDGRLSWNGDTPLHLHPAKRFLIVVAAVCRGWCAVCDTPSCLLEPVRIR